MMLKKINKYLLENYPLLYHSKLPYVFVVGIVLWLFSIGSGYLYFDKATHIARSIDRHYFHSSFIILHGIILIIICSIWLMKFYKDNPIKHYFPLQKMYYSRLLLQVFTGLLVLISAKIPFDYGVQLKYKHIFNVSDLPKDIHLFKLSKPLLIKDYKNLYLSEKQHPMPFPLQGFVKSKGDSKWYKVNDNLYNEYNTNITEGLQLYYNPKFIKGNTLVNGYLTENLFPGILDSLQTTIIDGDEFLFYKDRNVYIDGDSCSSKTVISNFVDLSHLKNLHKYSLYNYSNFQSGNTYSSYDSYEYQNENFSKIVNKSLVQTLHDLLDKKDRNEIEKVLSDLTSRLEFYEIRYHLQPAIIAEYLVEKEFKDFDFNVVENSIRDHSNSRNDYPIRDFTNLEKRIQSEEMFLDNYELRIIKSNYEDVLDDFWLDGWFVMINIAFYLSLIILWFEITELKPFLLSIPTGGLICIIFGAFISLTNYDGPFILVLMSGYAVLIFAVGLYFIFKKNIKKFLASISINILFVLSVFLIFLFIATFEENMLEWKQYDCSTSGNWEKKYRGLTNPFLLFFTSLFSIFPFFSLVKIWKAKKN